MKVVWGQRAQADVHEAFEYVALDKRGAAERVVARLTEAGNGLAQMPRRGRVGKKPGTREFVVPGLPYVLIYEISGEVVRIHRVMHGARNR